MSVKTPLRLLMVEDSEDDAWLLLRVLGRNGFEVHHRRVERAPELATALAEGGWDLVISDYSLPRFDGLAAVRQVRAHDADLPIILVSGTIGEEIAVEVMRHGASDYLMKDRLTRLAPAVMRVLREYSQRRAHLAAEQALNAERERALVTLNAITDAVIGADAEGRITLINPEAERLTGWSSAEAIGRPVHEVFRLVQEVSHEPLDDTVATALRTGCVYGPTAGALLARHDGQLCAVDDTAAPIHGAGGKVQGAVLVFRDLSERRRLAEQSDWQQQHDTLTGLPNRCAFEQRLEALLEGAHTRDERHALIFLDMDQFRVINDTCGHAAGDALLKELAGLLSAELPGDALARIGGDEFAILLQDQDLAQAEVQARRLLEIVSGFHFEWEGLRFDCTTSAGLVAIEASTESAASLQSAADLACYMAKELGRNRVHIHHVGDAQLAQRQREMHWAGRLTRALEENRFCLHRQTIHPLSGAVDPRPHHEILLRLRGEDGTLVLPGEFLPAAERYNLMPNLDRWVIRTTFAYMATERAHGEDGCYAINLSGTSLNEPGLFEYILEQRERYAIEPRDVCFEITETAAINQIRAATLFIKSLRRVGFRFSLDDFGAGLSSFSYLKQLPVDFLKIDGHFVRDILTDPMDRAIVEAINTVGHALGLQTIAEFVESDAISERLTLIGVDYAQGYGIAHPVPL